ncbi:LacI family DNA-binding transcriptional regulator [Terrarubrum flagellatum]|uniref:LacI family DNA-binding transcriptional regulator n=1 Tax=Terrirubrum flagellatum TaxID=2895980 RepID=UPI003145206B
MANIRDVAKSAGVSIATVSAALNESGRVSDETRRRVWAAAEAVGYSPNSFARSLRLGKSRLIGVVVADIANPFWGAMVRIVEKAAIAAGYSVIVSDIDDDETRVPSILDHLRSQHVAGILLTPVGHAANILKQIESRKLPPLVTVDQRVPGLARDFIGVDNRATIRMLVEYLLRLGHRRIAMISGGEGLWTADERLSGFVETMSGAGVEVDSSLCLRASYKGDGAYAATTSLLTRPDRPTAIIGANNAIALNALQVIFDLGFHCPGDVSLAGIDDVPWSGLVRPRVTTAAQPINDISAVAIEWLLERIMAPDDVAPPRERIFHPYFIAGDSCRDIRGEAGARQAAGQMARS